MHDVAHIVCSSSYLAVRKNFDTTFVLAYRRTPDRLWRAEIVGHSLNAWRRDGLRNCLRHVLEYDPSEEIRETSLERGTLMTNTASDIYENGDFWVGITT